ncbi:MAG: metal-sulfur cluster assembly factor [Bradymonadaceae bacterium]
MRGEEMWELFTTEGRGERSDEGAVEEGDHPFDLDEGDVPAEPTADTEHLFDALRRVVDPELGINLVDLGLVYALERDEDTVRVAITATTPACPMQGVLVEDAEQALADAARDGRSVEVYLVWEPRWRADWMTDEAGEQLQGPLSGLF